MVTRPPISIKVSQLYLYRAPELDWKPSNTKEKTPFEKKIILLELIWTSDIPGVGQQEPFVHLILMVPKPKQWLDMMGREESWEQKPDFEKEIKSQSDSVKMQNLVQQNPFTK